MIDITNVDAFLTLKLNQISSRYNPEKVSLYRSFYNEINLENLRELFSIIHSQLNDLFSFMNDKNSLGSGGHYNADPSRELIELIEQLRVLQATINDEYSFEIDDYYKRILDTCRTFLSKRNGSVIPDDFPVINLIEDKPIFILAGSIVVRGPEMKSSVKIKLVGEGSYAKVFKYRDSHYGCHFAIKRANKDLRPDEVKRFRNEYNYLKDLDSPYIIKVYHYDEAKTEYTMEYVNQTLKQFIDTNNSTLSFRNRRILVIQLLNAFEYIHTKGILHRDISYQNILVKYYNDSSLMVKVSDFGMVKLAESELTRQGTEIKGAINDFSDLNVVGFENYEIRHETYALAKVIYFILTGRQSKYHRENNSELKNFILRGISTNKEIRFTSIEEMRQELINIVFPTLRWETQGKFKNPVHTD